MQREVEKNAVVIYESVVNAIKTFPEKERGKLARIIVHYGTSGEADKLSEEYRIALQPIFDGIDTEKRRYRNVQFLQNAIDGIKRKTVNITSTKDNKERQVIDNLIKALQRMVVYCKAHDKLTEHIKIDVEILFKDPIVRKILGYRELTAEEMAWFDKAWSGMYIGVPNYIDKER